METSPKRSDMFPDVVVLTNGNYFARIILEDLFRNHSSAIKGVIIVTGDYHGRSGVKAGWHLLRSMTFPYFLYKVVSLFAFAAAQRLYPHQALTVSGLCHLHNVPYLTVKRINSENALAWARTHNPELFVSVSCPQRIRQVLLDHAPLGGINIHSSILPAYAGLAPYFWVLSNAERETGATVHRMTRNFDEGNILTQASLPIMPGESAFHLFIRLAHLGAPLLEDACLHHARGEEGIQQSKEGKSYFSHPDFKAYLRLKRNGHCLVRFGELWHALKPQTGIS